MQIAVHADPTLCPWPWQTICVGPNEPNHDVLYNVVDGALNFLTGVLMNTSVLKLDMNTGSRDPLGDCLLFLCSLLSLLKSGILNRKMKVQEQESSTAYIYCLLLHVAKQ